MSEAIVEPAVSAPAVDKHAWTQRVLADILRLMELPARLDLKDGPDGGISVALHFESEVPGVQPGRRSHLIDSLQFLLNKIVNRPNTDRKWISLGVGGHPEPRPPPAPRQPAPAPAAPARPRTNGAARPASAPTAAPAPAPTLVVEEDELQMKVSPDEAMAKVARTLAEKSAKLGRFYAVMPMKREDRARLVQAASQVKGLTLRTEGEGFCRRVVFQPDKPVPMPKQVIHPADEDDAEG